MLLQEFFTRTEDQEDYRDDAKDETKAKKDDTRKTRLTLAHLNKLRKMNDARTVEHEEDIKKVQQQYKPAEGGDEGGGLGL